MKGIFKPLEFVKKSILQIKKIYTQKNFDIIKHSTNNNKIHVKNQN